MELDHEAAISGRVSVIVYFPTGVSQSLSLVQRCRDSEVKRNSASPQMGENTWVNTQSPWRLAEKKRQICKERTPRQPLELVSCPCRLWVF